MQNLFAPLGSVRAQLEYRRPVHGFQAKLATLRGYGLQIAKSQLETQRPIFTAKKNLGRFQQRLAARLLLAKLHHANRFIPHKAPRKTYKTIAGENPASIRCELPGTIFNAP